MIDRTLRIALIGGLASTVLGAVLWFVHHEREVGREEVRTQVAADKSKRQSVALSRTTGVLAGNAAKDAKADKVDHATQIKNTMVAADAGRATDAHRSLLHTLDRVRADAMRESATRARLAAQVATATHSLGECSGRYQAVAEERDGLSVQVIGLLNVLDEGPDDQSSRNK